MKRNYQELFDEVHASSYLKQEVLNLKNLPQKESKRPRNVWPALAAAILCLSLCIGAAAGVYYSLGDWILEHGIQYYDVGMNHEKAEFIDHLSQPVNQSHTVDDVTIWIDSITIGNEAVWVLVNIKGLDFEGRKYEFGSWMDDFDPMAFFTRGEERENIKADITLNGGVIQEHVENGVCRKLFRFGAIFKDRGSLFDGIYTLNLDIRDIKEFVDEKYVMAKEGRWYFSIPLKPEANPTIRTIDKIEVMLPTERTGSTQEELCILEDVQISCTNVRFRTKVCPAIPYTNDGSALILKDGTEVHCWKNGTGSIPLDAPIGIGEFEFYYQPEIPVDVNDILALRAGNYIIPLTE